MATLAYFTVPKILETDPRYADLSIEARYLYAHMRDTLKLSIKNHWRDEVGYFIKMTRESMGALLKRSLPTIRKILCALVRAGLIVDRRLGLTRCNKIYIKFLDGESVADFQSKPKATAPSAEKPCFIPDRKGFTPNNHNPSHPNPTNPKNRRWFIKEGDKWIDGEGQIWEFRQGDVQPFYTRSALGKLIGEALPEIAF